MTRERKPSGRPKRRSSPDADRSPHRGPSAQSRRPRLFYVAVEGERTEVDYLRKLRKEFDEDLGVEIHPLYVEHGMTPTRTVEHVLAVASDAVDEYDADPPDDPGERRKWESRRPQLWVLFDRDIESHHDIPAAFRKARAEGVRVGYSNPSFELWLLLHFTDVTDRQSGRNGTVIQRLRGYEGFAEFDRHGDKKIDDVRFGALMPPGADRAARARAAAKRARRMPLDCSHQACPSDGDHHPSCDPTGWDPYTSVWRLLAELGVIDVKRHPAKSTRDRSGAS